MGTRSLTFVYNGEQRVKNICVCMYQQYDGYPSGVGLAIAKFLEGRAVVNGIGAGTPSKASNGMSCLAASLVYETKDGIGGTYLYPTRTRDAGQDYEYHIYLTGDYYKNTHQIMVRVRDYNRRTIFKGTVEQFMRFCEKDI